MPNGYYGLFCAYTRKTERSMSFLKGPARRRQKKSRDAVPWRGEIRGAPAWSRLYPRGGGEYTANARFFTERGPRIFAIIPGFGSTATLGGGGGRARFAPTGSAQHEGRATRMSRGAASDKKQARYLRKVGKH
jgi:hypothetical protein